MSAVRLHISACRFAARGAPSSMQKATAMGSLQRRGLGLKEQRAITIALTLKGNLE